MAVRRNESNLPTLAARSGQPPGSWSEPRAAIMAAIFGPRANLVTNATLIALAALALFAAFLIWAVPRMQYNTQVSLPPPQPVPFSHQHHVSGLGIDCRYCHTSVEIAPSAGVPPTETCMTCHSQIWTNAAMLAPVRQSREQATALAPRLHIARLRLFR